MELLSLLRREAAIDLRRLAVMTALSAVSTTLILGLIAFGAEKASSGDVSLVMVAAFLAAIPLFILSQNYVMTTTAREVEAIIQRLRLNLFEGVRNADIPALDSLGRAPLFAALANDTQTISRTMPLLVIGAQQGVTLVFVALFLAWLSLSAFAIAAVFSVIALTVHFRRSRALSENMQQVSRDEQRLFGGLGHVLDGFKEIRVNALRAEQVVTELSGLSAEVRQRKSAIKRQWAIEFAFIQVVFFLLLGLMVFVVPLFSEGFAKVAVEATTVALFLVGPIGTVAQAIPAIADAGSALAAVQRVIERLRDVLANGEDENAEALAEPIREIALDGIRFSYREADGSPGFSVGPLDVVFKTGELVVVTGGNGSGKSTVLRLLTALLRPDQGRLRINGEPLRAGQRQAYRDHIAAVFSDYHLFRRLYGLGSIDPDNADALLRRLQIAEKVAVRDGAFTTVDLSGGQRKRLALMVALLEDKPVLILDEWAADQDPQFRRLFYEKLLPALKRPDRIIVCVTHDDRYFGIADRILDMQEGRFRA